MQWKIDSTIYAIHVDTKKMTFNIEISTKRSELKLPKILTCHNYAN